MKNINATKIRTFLLIMLFTISSSHAYAELPQAPNLEELCEHSKIVICGEPIKQDSQIKTIGILNRTKYNVITFKVHKIYKGNSKIKEIKVLIPIKWYWECPQIPNYKNGEKYLLFLKSRPFGKLYIRVKIDDIFRERKWNKDKEQKVIEELKFLSDPNRWKKPGDNVNYTIPTDANEKLVELTEYQKKHDYSRRAEYWLNRKLVGERAWYGNGQIAYEQPKKNDLRHGIAKGWYPDEKPLSVSPYRKDRLHGVPKQWEDSGEPKISYWIRGKYVSKKEYQKACKTNMTLPKIKD